ncbi:hypothetical protein ACFP2T_43200 [Plantactinospora solaniradicis]|uniref:Uncharacterized protein n=1 Tax=Plantactinospora solaniradicis TaxID=1723736 RepID=A0ABW1KM97_9ACTN
MADPAGEGEDSKYAAGDRIDDDERNDDERDDDDQDAASNEVDDDDQDGPRGDGDSEVPKGTAEAVAYWLRKDPNMDPELLAERIGKSLRSVYRYLPPDYPRQPGTARERTRLQPGPAGHPSRSE